MSKPEIRGIFGSSTLAAPANGGGGGVGSEKTLAAEPLPWAAGTHHSMARSVLASNAWMFLALCSLHWACGSDEDGTADDGDTGGTPSAIVNPPVNRGGSAHVAARGGNSNSATADGGQADTEGGETSYTTDNTNGQGACSTTLGGSSCATSDSCSWADQAHCTQGGCDCVDGLWVCGTSTMSPCGVCPLPQSFRCGDDCTGTSAGCLCSCSGADDFRVCSCQGGIWKAGP